MDVARIAEVTLTVAGVGLVADVLMTACLVALFIVLVVLATHRSGGHPPRPARSS